MYSVFMQIYDEIDKEFFWLFQDFSMAQMSQFTPRH